MKRFLLVTWAVILALLGTVGLVFSMVLEWLNKDDRDYINQEYCESLCRWVGAAGRKIQELVDLVGIESEYDSRKFRLVQAGEARLPGDCEYCYGQWRPIDPCYYGRPLPKDSLVRRDRKLNSWIDH